VNVRAGVAAPISAAMNMAWTTDATSTSFRALSTLIVSSKGDPMKNAVKNSLHVAGAAGLALMLSLAAGAPAQAQSGPSPQEQMACRSDAGKFCAEHIGKPPQMNACLRANKASLSDGCRKVVESRGG
jgi:hypothetical protein